MYNHFQYSEKICKQLKPFNWSEDNQSFFRATEQTELEELNANISNAAGMVMIALKPQVSTFSWNNSDNLVENPAFSLVIAKQTSSSDTDTIFAAQEECDIVTRQIIARMLCDARDYVDGCNFIDFNSIITQGIGPIGPSFYGIIMMFNTTGGISYKLNEELWG